MNTRDKGLSGWGLISALIVMNFPSCDNFEELGAEKLFDNCNKPGALGCSDLILHNSFTIDASKIEPPIKIKAQRASKRKVRISGPPCQTEQRYQSITFMHVNDLHAHYAPKEDGVSRYARISGYVKRIRSQNPYTLFTGGGDDYEKGSVAELLSDGQSTLQVMHSMKMDVRVLGNHDFAWSAQHTAQYSNDPNAVVLSSNTRYIGENSEAWGATDYAEFQVGCARIGVFGFTTKPWDEKDQELDGDYYPEMHTDYDYERQAIQMVSEHREDVDLLVMINHLGHYYDVKLGEAVPGIDVILGGHSHTKLQQPENVYGTLVVQAGSQALYTARLDIKFDNFSRAISDYEYKLIKNNATDMPDIDPDVANTVDSVMAKYAPQADHVLGYTDAGSSSTVEIAKIAVRAGISILETDAALIHAEEVWTRWDTDAITEQMLFDAFKIQRHPPGTPGTSSFYIAELKGEELAELYDGLDGNWHYEGVRNPDPEKVYALALQKKAALHPSEYLNTAPKFMKVTFASEAFHMLEQYARQRTFACLYLDSETQLVDCP